MKLWAVSGVAVGVFASSVYLVLSTGCNWQGGAGSSAPNPAYNFVNFSGNYRGASGGPIVINDAEAQTNATGYTATTNSVSGAVVGTGDGVTTAFSGTLANPPMSGSVQFSASSYSFTDPTGSGTLTNSTDGSTGTINYSTGAWMLDFATALANGVHILANYSYVTVNSPALNSGVTGPPVFSFVVEQFGSEVSMTDNNGATYKGTLGDIRGTGGNSELTSQTSTNFYATPGDQFIANFTANGKSAAGIKVKIVGVFQSTVITGGKTFTLGNLTIGGTWIESNGVSGDITGSSGATYTISFSTSNSGTNQSSSSSSTTGG